jgi:hypothetical protein
MISLKSASEVARGIKKANESAADPDDEYVELRSGDETGGRLAHELGSAA